jgi:hypothetical protein
MSILDSIRRYVVWYFRQLGYELREACLDILPRIRHRGSKELMIVFDDEGFRTTQYGRVKHSMLWCDLTRVRFEQYDSSIEFIYFFFGDDEGHWLNFYEFAEGLKEFQAAVDARWPGYARVTEDYCQYAWGRSNSIPHLQLELVAGQTLLTPEEWFSQVPTYAKAPPFWQVWKIFS